VNDRSDPWAPFDSWDGPEIRREAWYFPSGDDRLFASLYARHRPRGPAGFVICPSWGPEFDRLLNLCHDLARALCEGFAAAVVYHPPGHGDSTGDPASLSFDDLVEACLDAHGSVAGRFSGLSWNLVGVRLGAAVAAVAADRSRPDVVLFIQPAFDVPAYFGELERARRRGRPDGTGAERTLFGYPRPHWSRDGREDVTGALRRLTGTALAIHAAEARIVRRDDAAPDRAAPGPNVLAVTSGDRWRPQPAIGRSRRLVETAVRAARSRLGDPPPGRTIAEMTER
jgi:alpha-beta hydrolase superfamily lysophospholipase